MNELDNYVNEICVKVASKIRDELTETAIQAINDFYKWKPKYYYRHENFIRKYKPQKYYHNQNNKVFRGGVKLLIPPNVYQDSPSTVADFVYHGLHGWASIGWHGTAPIMKPSPLEIINKKKESIEKNIQKYFDAEI